ncbi:MAG: 3-isopropylmalate dehydratase small subunit [Thermovirgaceae bacterium]
MDAIEGRVFTFGNNIDTDQIYPGRYLDVTGHREIANHVMEGADPFFASLVKPGDIIVAGTNFGCGSSREHAVIALKNAGIGAVVARSFARIFFRNAINQGLLVVEVPDLDELEIKTGDRAQLDVVRGEFVIEGNRAAFRPLPEHILNIMEAGGIFSLFRQRGVRAFEE